MPRKFCGIPHGLGGGDQGQEAPRLSRRGDHGIRTARALCCARRLALLAGCFRLLRAVADYVEDGRDEDEDLYSKKERNRFDYSHGIHLFYENVIPRVVGHYSGVFFADITGALPDKPDNGDAGGIASHMRTREDGDDGNDANADPRLKTPTHQKASEIPH